MKIINPDINWYTEKSAHLRIPPRCPYANVERCPRYFESLSLNGETGSTKIDPREDERLRNIWEKSELWPQTLEQAASISGSEKITYSNFCPEVLYERFGLFAYLLSPYYDEIDIDVQHKQLGRENAESNDWRWNWAIMKPMHYAECPYYSLLLKNNQKVISKGVKNMDVKKVFISYVHENSNIIDKICKELKQSNIEYWIDREKINPGREWKVAIENAINDGGIFLACFSEEYEKKHKTHMNEEINLAVKIYRSMKPDSGWLIPIRINDCSIPEFEIAPGKYLSNLHYIDLFEEFELNIQRLISAIKQNDNIKSQELNINNIISGKDDILSFKALKSIIDSGSGDYFYNADMGHPVYLAGAKGQNINGYWSYADGPKKNTLFLKLSELSNKLKNSSYKVEDYIWWYDFSAWKDFCSYVIEVYKKKRNGK